MEAVPRRAAAVRLSAALDTTGVERVRLWPVEVPLAAPLVSSHGAELVRRSTLVEVLLASGAHGWGECPALARPTYTGEYAAGAWRLLHDELVPAALAGRGDDIRGHPMARFALESALVDARLREAGQVLVDVVAPHGPRRLSRSVVLGRQNGIDALLVAVAAAVRGGAALVKLKIEPGWDREPLLAVRRAFPGLALAADANGAYAGAAVGAGAGGGSRAGAGAGGLGRVAGLASVLGFADEAGLTYLEQPVAPGDLVAHAALARALATPLALDESVTSLHDVHSALAVGAVGPSGAVNVKPARLGGIAAALAVLECCAAEGVARFVGGMLELGVGRAAATAVGAAAVSGSGSTDIGASPRTAIAALPPPPLPPPPPGPAVAGAALPADLGPSEQYVARDVTDPIVLDSSGRLVVPSGAGIGVEVRMERLREVVVAPGPVELRR